MADIQVKRKTSLTLTETFYLDGAPQDLDSGVPTVVATAPDGTTTTYNAASTPAVQGTWAGPPARTTGQYRLVVAAQPEVTWRDLAWTGTIGGQSQTLESRVEWIGADLFTLSAFRALRVNGQTPFAAAGVTPLFTDAQIMGKRAAILDEFTTALGFSPVQRLALETHDGGGSIIQLDELKASRLLSVKVAGVAQSLNSYSLSSAGALRPASGYAYGTAIPAGLSNVVVEYVHGTERPPGKGSDMAMVYASAMLNPSGFSSAVTVSTPEGVSYSYEPSEVGRGGYQRWTGIRDVDRWLNMHRAVAGVA